MAMLSLSSSSEVPTVTIKQPTFAGYQLDYLDAPQRFTAVEASTKSGKSFSRRFRLFKSAHTPVEVGDEYWWVGPTLDQARTIGFEPLARLVATLPGYQVNRVPMRIVTPAGGVLRFHTGENPDHLYGPSNVREIVGDEFTRMRLDCWQVFRSLVTATKGRIDLIGNYTGEDSAWHVWIKKMIGDPDFAYFKITAMQAVEAGIMDGEEVESARRSMTPSQFAALYMCEGVADPSMLVDYAAIMDLWMNEHVVATGTKCITADIARYGHDSTVVGLWDGYRLTKVTRLERSGMDECVTLIRGIATAEGVPMSRVIVDDDGVGGGVVDHLKCTPFNGGSSAVLVEGNREQYANLRSQCYFRLAQIINARGMMIATPEHRDLMERELFLVRRGDDRGGKLAMIAKDEVKVRLGRSPDFSDMLMMRMYLDLTGQPAFIDSVNAAAERTQAYIRRQRPKPPSERMPYSGR